MAGPCWQVVSRSSAVLQYQMKRVFKMSGIEEVENAASISVLVRSATSLSGASFGGMRVVFYNQLYEKRGGRTLLRNWGLVEVRSVFPKSISALYVILMIIILRKRACLALWAITLFSRISWDTTSTHTSSVLLHLALSTLVVSTSPTKAKKTC